MLLQKKLKTGTVIKAWNYDEGNTAGQTVAAKNGSTGDFEALVHVESVECSEGIVNRLVIKKNAAEKLGWTVVEEEDEHPDREM